MNQASLEGIKTSIESLTTWSPKDYWLLGVSIGSLIVSIVALLIYRRALKVSQEQNLTANSIELKNSYKYIIEKMPIPFDDVDGRFHLFMKQENPIKIKYDIETMLEELTKQQHKNENIRLFDSWIDTINIGLLHKINSDKQLLKHHKLELSLYFGEKSKLKYIDFNNFDCQSVPSEENISFTQHIAYRKYKAYESIKLKYEKSICS